MTKISREPPARDFEPFIEAPMEMAYLKTAPETSDSTAQKGAKPANWNSSPKWILLVVAVVALVAIFKVAQQAGAEIVSEPKRGYGAAAWTGLQNLSAEIERILFSSADGSDRLTPAQFDQWLQEVRNGTDLILGDRCSSCASRRHLNFIQRLGNCFACTLIRLGWGAKFRDMGSLRLIRRAALENLKLQDRGFGWNIEMQVRAVEHGLRISELPVDYYPRNGDRSKISGNLLGTFSASWGMLLMLGRLFLQTHRSVHAGAVDG